MPSRTFIVGGTRRTSFAQWLRRSRTRASCVLAIALATSGPSVVGRAQTPSPASAWRPDPAPPPQDHYTVTRGARISMRDGVRLSADLYVPQGAGQTFPAILVRTPYDKRGGGAAAFYADLFATRGYVLVVVDKRGRFESEGEYTIGHHEIADAYDVMEWMTHQPWSNGKIGAYGCSDGGDAVVYDAVARHPALKAVIPEASGSSMGRAGNWYRYFGGRNGGAIELAMGLGWFAQNGTKVFLRPPSTLPWERFVAMRPGYRLALEPPAFNFDSAVWSLPVADILKNRGLAETDYDSLARSDLNGHFFMSGDFLKGDEQVDVPALFVDSWYDFAPGVVLSERALFERNATTPAARQNQYAVMSPSLHCNSTRLAPNYRVGARDVGDPSYPMTALYIEWFDHWLKGVNNGIATMPKVQYYLMGENRWLTGASWPLPESHEVRLFLNGPTPNGPRAGGRLLASAGPEGRDSLVYDPAHPAPSVGGSLCCIKSDKLEGAYDQREVEQRPDVLTYSTGPLKTPIRVAGPVEATLYVSSDRRDTDFTVKLVDVYPDGTAYNVLEGVLRARYRDGFETPKLMVPGETYELRIPMQDIANSFGVGHQLRLEVSSSSFPRFDRNLNTGGLNVDETQWLVATNAVYRGGRHASSISLRVIE